MTLSWGATHLRRPRLALKSPADVAAAVDPDHSDDVAGLGHRVDAVGRIVADWRVDDVDAVGPAVARPLVGAHRRTVGAGPAAPSGIDPHRSRTEDGDLGALGSSASWGLGTGYRALRFAAANCTPPGWPLSGVSRPVSGVIAQGFADVPLESRWAALARPACRLGRARREKFAELAAICLAVGGADQAAQHNTGLHRGLDGPERCGVRGIGLTLALRDGWQLSRVSFVGQYWAGRFEGSGRLVGASGPRRGTPLRRSFATPEIKRADRANVPGLTNTPELTSLEVAILRRRPCPTWRSPCCRPNRSLQWTRRRGWWTGSRPSPGDATSPRRLLPGPAPMSAPRIPQGDYIG